jgi:hypothetical protein
MGLCGSKSTVPNADPRKDWEKGVPVYVNVYDLQARGSAAAGQASMNGAMGLGAYHSGIQVFNTEFSFGGDPSGKNSNQTGVFAVNPKSALPMSQFHKQHIVGHLPAGTRQQQVFALINAMKPKYPMSRYHLVKCNCNHFSEAFLWALDEEFNIKPVVEQQTAAGVPPNKVKAPERTLFLPAYVNRAARFGSVMAPTAVIKALSRGAPAGEVPDDDGAGPSPPPASAPPPSSQPDASAAPAPAAAQPSAEQLRRENPLPNDREKLEHMSAKCLRNGMRAHAIDATGCIEKSEFVDAVMRYHQEVGTPAGASC